MFFTFDLCLLLYVIRLAGWLKHCNLSLSQVGMSTLPVRTLRHHPAQVAHDLLLLLKQTATCQVAIHGGLARMRALADRRTVGLLLFFVLSTLAG